MAEVEELKYANQMLSYERDYFRNLYELEKMERENAERMLKKDEIETAGNKGNEEPEGNNRGEKNIMEEDKSKARETDAAEKVQCAEKKWKVTLAKLEETIRSLGNIKKATGTPRPLSYGN